MLISNEIFEKNNTQFYILKLNERATNRNKMDENSYIMNITNQTYEQ